MSRFILATFASILLAVAIGVAFLIAPHRLPASVLTADYKPNLAKGETLFIAGICSACHTAPGETNRKKLAGGVKLNSSFGRFVTPNISPDVKDGVGGWTDLQFVNAMKRGVGRHGEHLYPSFPYGAYSLLSTADVRDLFAYIKTLPAVAGARPPHQLKFPFNLRPTVGVWKALYFKPVEFLPDPKQSAEWNRGAYLAEGPAHCAECHTPRGALGDVVATSRYAGAPNLEAGGRYASNITPDADGLADWTAQDIADFLKSGTDKCFNEPTGMRDVVASTSNLSEADLSAIGTYIHALPARPGGAGHKTC